MYSNNTRSPNLNIELEPGIYRFDCESGSGKTRLCKALKDYRVAGEPVISYSYQDSILGLPIDNVLVPNKYKVIMLDRYDMYNGSGVEILGKCVENTVILIDCKGSLKVPKELYSKVHFCCISMDKNEIEVF